MRAGIDGLADFGEMLLHGPGVAIGKNKTCAFAFLRADRAEDTWSADRQVQMVVFLAVPIAG